MDERSKLKTVSANLSLSERYVIGRMLMLREKLRGCEFLPVAVSATI